ncbi:hypothetical protein CMU00_08840 [Elizabethkingia anophelis]|nr:hypothetical protein [Elizabethkingia anophelis]
MEENKKKESIAICLNCYKIRFYEKNKKNNNEKKIESVFGTTSLPTIMARLIRNIENQKVFTNKEKDRILYLDKSLVNSEENNVYVGIIMKGHNGPQTTIDELIENRLINIGTVHKDQFHCLPYLFLLYINKNNPEDIIFIAQSYRQYGFKEVFEDCFRQFVNLESQDTTVKFNPLSIGKLFEKQVHEGFINSIRFRKHGLEKNVEAIANGDKIPSQEYRMELKIQSSQGFWGIKKNLSYDDTSFMEQVKIDGFDYTEAFADIIIGNRKRSINITKPKEFVSAYDITNDIRINQETKLPVFEDIKEQAIDILNNDLIPYL